MKKNSKVVDACNVNFGKVKDRSVKVYVGDKKHEGVEIIGSRGKYAINADASNGSLANLRGKSGSLKEVKKYVANHLCEIQTSTPAPVVQTSTPAQVPGPTSTPKVNPISMDSNPMLPNEAA